MSSAPGREEMVADLQGCGGLPLCAQLSVRRLLPLQAPGRGGGGQGHLCSSWCRLCSKGLGEGARLSWRGRSGWKPGPEPLEAGLPSRGLSEPHFPA